ADAGDASSERAPPAAEDDLGLDFDFDAPAEAPAAADEPPAPQATAATLPPEVAELSLDLPVDEPPAAAAPEPPDDDAAARPAAAADSAAQASEPEADQDPLETKLSLAREFEAIGDIDGARILAEEVAAEAQGELRARAQAFLAQLG
ncbi:MAG: FimV/HubP family polar landmark protein, partial [Tepidimonas sp.]|uniref:FimV/HubP family polar landmark protein n=1 Tax=Tepidimonas sp. TaxID=2002775 RepID=UPI00298EF0E5